MTGAMPRLEFAFEAKVTVASALEVGATPYGRRRVIHITGGTFVGPRLRSTIVPGGADWQIIRTDGVAELMAVYDIQTDDGTLIHVTNRGLRHGPDAVMQRLIRGEPVEPDSYYFRTVPVFEAPAGKYEWLNRSIFVASASRSPDEVVIRVFEVV